MCAEIMKNKFITIIESETMKKILKPLSLAAAISAALISGQVMAYEAGDIIVRAGITTVDPQESSDQLALNGSEAAFIGAVGAEELGLDSDTQLGLTIEYMLDSNWGVELLAATPFEHTATTTGALNGLDIADIKHLPPTLSAVYHFNNGSAFQPYVGAGLNYTIFFSEDTTNAADATFATLGLTGGNVELDDSLGLALQVGFDYQLNEKWLVNASVRWIDIDTEATIKFDNGSKISSDVDVDPMVYSVMIGYKF